MSAPRSECLGFRELIDARLDAPLGLADAQSLEAHLGVCRECAHYRDEVRELRAALVALPTLEFPEHELAVVWTRTVASDARMGRPRARRAQNLRYFAACAAAALLTVVALTIVVTHDGDVSDDELARAENELRLVMGHADRALSLAERAALGMAVGRGVRDPVEKTRIATTRDVLVGIVSPSFERTGADAPAPRPRRGPKPRSDRSRRRRRS